MRSPKERSWAEALVAEYYQGLYRYAYRLTGSATEAEDLTQETFLKALIHQGQLRDATRVRPWLYSILRHEYLQRCRAAQQRGTMVSLEDCQPVTEEADGPPEHIDEERLQQGLLQLPEEFRTPVILTYWQDFRYQDIAELMGIPVGTVMSRLWRAKQWLKRWLSNNSGQGPFVALTDQANPNGTEANRTGEYSQTSLRRSQDAM